MPNKNIADSYNKLIDAFGLISDNFEKGLPKFTESEFLKAFGTEFQGQLSDAGKNVFTSILEQTILSPVQKSSREAFQKDYEDTVEALIKDFTKTFDLDTSIKKVQRELQVKLSITKQQLLTSLSQELSDKGQVFSPEDKTKLETVFTEYLDKNYNELSKHLEKFKDLPAVYAKYQSHLGLTAKQAKSDKNVSHTVDRDPTLEELLSEPKSEPVFGLKVNKDNLKKQILHDIANGKSIEINVRAPGRSALIKKMADIGFQTNSPGLALLHIIIFTIFGLICDNDEKRVVTAIKGVIEENQLFGLDPSKITLKITTPTADGKERVTREGPLTAAHTKELQSKVDEIKNKLQAHSLQVQNKKSGSTTPTLTESGYNSEEEQKEVLYPRPRF
ncbi:MAG: hypothetical protein RJA83_1386 [Pseudomonadota bacterium]|jgi:hypothetical protein